MNNVNAKRLRRIAEDLSAPVDIAYLACARIALGGLLTWLLFQFIRADVPGQMFIAPEFHFSYRWFEWIQPLPGSGMYVLFYVLLLCSLLIMTGLVYRAAIWVFFCCWTYFFLIDPAYYMNHFYLVGLLAFLFGFMPANAALSLDAIIRPSIRSNTTPMWTIWALRAQIGIAYFYAGVTKIQSDWISGAAMRAAIDSWSIPPWFVQAVGEEPIVILMSYGGLILDLAIVPGLLWWRTRWFFVIAAAAFHTANSIIFKIDIFPAMAFALTLSYFDPGWPRTILRRIVRKRPEFSVDQARNLKPMAPWLLGLLAVFFVLQALVPLRHFAYPGNHNWTGEGHLFSWHLMSRSKVGRVVFMATDPQTGTTWRINPEDHLFSRQVTYMSRDPYLILQFAHFIGERMTSQGHGGVEVRAFSKVSLNGRPAQFFINPETDLTKVAPWQPLDGWLMPLEDGN